MPIARKLISTAILLLLCTPPLLADPENTSANKIVFNTDPPGLCVNIWKNDESDTPDFLGHSGEELEKDWTPFYGKPRAAAFSLAPGGAALGDRIRIDLHEAVIYHQWPKGGESFHVDVPWTVWLQLYVRHYPGRTLIPAIGGLLLLAAQSILFFRQRYLIRRPGAATQIPGYTVGQLIGAGGMGEVYLGYQNENPNRLLAIKIMKSSLSADEESKKRFEREVRICKQLSGVGFVPIYDWGETPDGRPYLVMEYLEGTTLKDKLDSEGQLPLLQVVDILRPLGRALQGLHDQGLTHRDVKPDNVFIERTGRVLLMDFGAATGAELTALTAEGSALGTPSYMAPEQIRGQAVRASDQYSLGVMTFYMLTGERPFVADDLPAMLRAHMEDTPPDPSKLRPELSVSASQAILRMMEKAPQRRFECVKDAIDSVVSALLSTGLTEDATITT